MLSSRPSKITPRDIERLVVEQVPEDEKLEFKKTLATKDGVPDSWISSGGSKSFGDRARNDLAKELIAFANRSGGLLILGIADIENRASKIEPIPKCQELASRLERSLSDVIEPRLPSIVARGVEIDTAGNGTVVISVEPSLMGPHRLQSNRECYIRRGEQTMAMSMREIQDLTLEISRNAGRAVEKLERLEKDFQDYSKGIVDCMAESEVNPEFEHIVFGWMGVPLDRVSIPQIAQQKDLPAGPFKFHAFKESMKLEVAIPVRSFNSFEPRLRAAIALGCNDDMPCQIGYGADGSIWSYCGRTNSIDFGRSSNSIYAGWLVALLANTLIRIEIARFLSNAVGVPYAIKFAIKPHGKWRLGGYADRSDHGYEMISSPVFFEPYEVGSSDLFPSLISTFERDLWNLFGTRTTESLEFKFPDFSELLRSTAGE